MHLAVCPHHGPTSKGDCLNWIYRRMQAFETAAAASGYEIMMTHDAEDLIHPESLRLVNWFSREYDMVQVPVLALPTPGREFTHGIYCDEFAEYQSKDIPVRQQLGGFLPSNGVGTGFSRRRWNNSQPTAAAASSTRSASPKITRTACGCTSWGAGSSSSRSGSIGAGPVATREYFPRTLRAAVRQRSRWVAGIALQGWQHHGWRVSARQRYWFWRDRKGLIGNLLSPATNLIML